MSTEPDFELKHLLPVCSAAALFFHVSTLSYELDFLVIRLLFAYIISLSAIWYQLQLPLYHILLMAVTFNATLVLSIVTYRSFFHRIRKFPGPFWAKVTRLWWVSKIRKTNQAYTLTRSLHGKYGDWVRIGPREISTTNVAAIPLIYGAGAKTTKPAFYNKFSNDRDGSLLHTRDKSLHAVRRKPWELILKGSHLTSIRPRVEKTTALFYDKLKESSAGGKPVDAARFCSSLAFDLIGEIAYSKSFGFVDIPFDSPTPELMKQLESATTFSSVGGSVPWTVRLALTIPGMPNPIEIFTNWCDKEANGRREMVSKGGKAEDLASWLLQAWAKPGAPKHTQLSQMSESRLMIVAGSDTTASAMTGFFYYLSTNPTAYKKLQSIVDDLFPGDAEYAWEKTQNVPYIEAVINETLRLQSPASASLLRETPREGLTIDDVFVPGNVVISVPTYTIHRDPRYWGRPEEFIPERWTDQPELCKDKRAFIPFTLGVYQCVGKQLALIEMRCMLARLAMGFDIELAEGQSGAEYEANLKDLFTLHCPALMVKLTPRERGD